jgi:hypothetical protein
VEDVKRNLYIVSGVLGGACFILIVTSTALGVMYARYRGLAKGVITQHWSMRWNES